MQFREQAFDDWLDFDGVENLGECILMAGD